jgi:hypothetical protein
MAGYFVGTKGCGERLDGCDGQALGVSLRWGLVSGAIGGLVGAAVGTRLETWRSVFP